MPGIPKKSLEFALLLILAHFNARLYRPCEPGMAQTQKPFKPVDDARLLHTRNAFELVGTRKFELLRLLRTVNAAMRFLSRTFGFANDRSRAYNAAMNGFFIVFNLLSALRRGTPAAQLWRIFQDIGQPLRPKTSFWLALCRQANLLNHNQRPTALAQEWLAWQPDAQILHLIQAWELAPHNRQERMLRKRLRLRLARGLSLRPSDARLLPGLDALGITNRQVLTRFGKAALGQVEFPSPVPIQPWQLDAEICQVEPACGRQAIETLRIPHNPNWSLLWRLEAFLPPSAPLTYSLDAISLRRAVERGDAEILIGILETGLKTALPSELRARILGLPTLKVATGLVLEFSDPAELRQLRRSEPLRSHFEKILSPRHILVNEKNAPRLLTLLERRGILREFPSPIPILELGEGSGEGSGSAHTFHAPRYSSPWAKTSPSSNSYSNPFINRLLSICVTTRQTRRRPEIHRITPMLIEERGGYTYVIAYSHTRKGQRTYRLDRMDVPGTHNNRGE